MLTKEIFGEAVVMELKNPDDIPRIKNKNGYTYPEEFNLTARGDSEIQALAALEEKVRTNFVSFKEKTEASVYAVTVRPVSFHQEPTIGNPVVATAHLSFTALPS